VIVAIGEMRRARVRQQARIEVSLYRSHRLEKQPLSP
jgi:hypothetical protein